MTDYIEVTSIQHIKKIYKISYKDFKDQKHLIDAVENSELVADYSTIISEDIIRSNHVR